MRRFLLLILAGALTLLMIGIAGGIIGHTGELTRERNTLTADATQQSQILDAYFVRASSIILLTANNPAFAQFYGEPGSREERVRRGGPTIDAVNNALAYLERLYPDSIGEACFIDAGGAENARAVRGERATYGDLSPNEADNPFFAPSFALKPGEVYQATPYVSPDTNEWVIANATLVPTADGIKRAIVHFEVTVESFRKEAHALTDRTLLVVDATSGAVVINSARPQQVGAPLGDPDDKRFVGLVGRWGDAGRLDLAGFPATYRRITATAGNANKWYVVTVANRPSGVMTGVGPLPPAVMVAALALLTFAFFGLRREQTALVSAANTDALTGLNNRRKLVSDLNTQLANATRDDPLLLILCDLNGFKAYNDNFGHPVGDVLLARLGATLAAAAVAGCGQAYRIGGDEFCILARPGQESVEEIVRLAACALTEHGDGFSITTAHGAILLPAEATTASEAMRAVDVRMYEQKNAGRVPADTQTINALVRAMHERDRALVERLTTTAELAGRVCDELGPPPTEVARIRRAAQLHDVGKVAVPDAILHKPGPLDPAEWAFVQQCPSIGERITAAAPGLAPLAPLIRSARERYDGTGYPDRLAGDDIPLGARIIAVCAALAAMMADRPYAESRDIAGALEDIREASGTQFDPQVVAAVFDAVRERTPAG